MKNRRRLRAVAVTVGLALLAGCTGSEKISPSAGTTGKGLYKVGKPYQVDGIWYYP